MQERDAKFHMQMVVGDGEAVGFYKQFSFRRVGKTQTMWVYDGNEHWRKKA